MIIKSTHPLVHNHQLASSSVEICISIKNYLSQTQCTIFVDDLIALLKAINKEVHVLCRSSDNALVDNEQRGKMKPKHNAQYV